ncbi:Predicted metal-dependent hydrolase, TIM-barrel fold [Pollutimonas bauzanensis]|uniref:Predicted metal-dependent hydrolase, TIM-barrel fold n=1 Tax=Pollutimonas bauzanensis TaxID=658167 RepID=A0A1M5R3J8_9BURK|nr:Predicted metal-dependent hydrolase, TIM-barrel fold [Pollutimonas bauzanensis]
MNAAAEQFDGQPTPGAAQIRHAKTAHPNLAYPETVIASPDFLPRQPDPSPAPHTPVRPDWLALRREDILDPGLPIIDAHHHLWEFPEKSYGCSDLLADIGQGHNITATVFIECKTGYRTSGAESLRPVGEIEFARSQGERAGGAIDICAGIVGYADLRLGAAVVPALQAQQAAAGGRLRGIRNITVWHADPSLRLSASRPPAGVLSDPMFRMGFRHLAPMGLSFDAWLVHTQLDELRALALDFPGTPIVLNHLGGPIAIGPYTGRRQDVFMAWRGALERLAGCPNVFMKIGGFGMPLFGFEFHRLPVPPSSVQIAAAVRPYAETCLELFGAGRCMFESNFPVDKGSFDYSILWNAFKRLAAGASATETASLFHDTAADFYGLAGDQRSPVPAAR